MVNTLESNNSYSVRAQRRTAFNPACADGNFPQGEALACSGLMYGESVTLDPEDVNAREVLHEQSHLKSCQWPLIETPNIVEAASHIAIFGKDFEKSFSIVAKLPISHPCFQVPNKSKPKRLLLLPTTTRRGLVPFCSSGPERIWFYSVLKLNKMKAIYLFIRVLFYSCLMAFIISKTGMRYLPTQPPPAHNSHSGIDSAVYLTITKASDAMVPKLDRRFVRIPAQQIQIGSKDDDEPVFFHALMNLDSHRLSASDPARVKNSKTKENLKLKKTQMNPKKISSPNKPFKNKKIPKVKKSKHRDLHPKVYQRRKAMHQGRQRPKNLLITATKPLKTLDITGDANTGPISVIPISTNVLPSDNGAGKPVERSGAPSPSSTTVKNNIETLIFQGLSPGFGQSSPESAKDSNYVSL